MFLSLEVENFLKDMGMGANQLDHEVYIVGGFVRERLYSEFHNKSAKPITDIDLVINTNAIEFSERFQKYYEDNHPEHKTFQIVDTFPGFGTCKISHPDFPDYEIELASTRRETYPEAADFPKVELIEDIEEDLSRRDFTINALLESLNKKNFGEIVDYTNAIDDMQKGLIRVFHNSSFINDPTRIPRALRFALKYNFEIEKETLNLLLDAIRDPRLEDWKKKRKSRFKIELDKIEEFKSNLAQHKQAEVFETVLSKLSLDNS